MGKLQIKENRLWDNLTFLPLDIPASKPELQKMCNEIKTSHNSFRCAYRNCYLLPLYTSGGAVEPSRVNSVEKEFQWTIHSEAMFFTKEFLKSRFFPFLNKPARVFVLISPPDGEVKLHIDCSHKNSKKRQHKIRIVVSGYLGGLWFLGANQKRHFIQTENPVYLIDGSQPHGMINKSQEAKLTICLGFPWSGSGGTTYLNLLEKSYSKYQREAILRSNIGRPDTRGLYLQDARAN